MNDVERVMALAEVYANALRPAEAKAALRGAVESLAAQTTPAPTPQQVSDYLHGLSAIERALIQRQTLAPEPSDEWKPKADFESWLRRECYQKPTPEAYDLAWSAWEFVREAANARQRPASEEPMVPAHKLQQAETRHANLLLDLCRVMDGEPTLCGFPEITRLEAIFEQSLKPEQPEQVHLVRGDAGSPDGSEGRYVVPFAEAIDPNQPWNLRRNHESKAMNLPPIEVVSDRVHEAWMESKRAQGVTSRKAEDGEELMVPYTQLSEKAKELDRGTVRAVYAAIAKAS